MENDSSSNEEKVPVKRHRLRDRSIIKPAKRPGQDSEAEAVDQATTSKTALLLSPGDNLVLEDLKPALTTNNRQKLPT